MADQDHTGLDAAAGAMPDFIDRTGGPAFGHAAYSPADDFTGSPGMTLRDWFAGQALIGWLLPDAIKFNNSDDGKIIYSEIAEASYAIADAMLKARQS